MISDRLFKERLYAQFARLGKALTSPRRLEILELLAQGERTVDSLAQETTLSVANVSQHLKALRAACLVESRRQGLKRSCSAAAGPATSSSWTRGRRGEYAAGHIAGALSMPVDDLEKRLKELPRKRAFVAYGRGVLHLRRSRGHDPSGQRPAREPLAR